ncbi:MAG TPA: helix-turn-helix domain-containing protein [Candidatus Thermoplasmatota archaeon]|nr:helix-turn-helix domain-containing protein [Candidatus Thermoplasmatota archaeon]
MPITPERVSKLREFGLSEYASRTYLALLDLGTAEARDISGISKVPASKVYRILEQLHEKGLVVILPEFPRKYAPVPFSDFLEKIHEEHARAADEIRRNRETLAAMFAVQGDVEGSDRGSFTVLRGRRNVMEKLAELASGARHDLLVLASPGMLRRPALLADLARAAEAGGATVRLLLPPGAGSDAAALDLGAQARVATASAAPDGGAMLVADGARAVIVHFLPDDGHAFEGSDTAMATDQAGVVGLLAGLVAPHWVAGQPLRPREVPVQTERPAAAPSEHA